MNEAMCLDLQALPQHDVTVVYNEPEFNIK
jgi:hypothetical protein